jgi:hypothetical protein
VRNCLHAFDALKSKDITAVLKMCSNLYHDLKQTTCQKVKLDVEMQLIKLKLDSLEADFFKQTETIQYYQEQLKSKITPLQGRHGG